MRSSRCLRYGLTALIILCINFAYFNHRLYYEYLKLDTACFQPKEHLEAVVYLVHSIDALLTKYNVTHWLNFGTLLGAMRRGDIIPWDHDADMAYFYSNNPQLRLMLESGQLLHRYNITFHQTPLPEPQILSCTRSIYQLKFRYKTAYLDLHAYDLWENVLKRRKIANSTITDLNSTVSNESLGIEISSKMSASNINDSFDNCLGSNSISQFTNGYPRYLARQWEPEPSGEIKEIVRLELPRNPYAAAFGCATHEPASNVFPIGTCKFAGTNVSCPAKPWQVLKVHYCVSPFLNINIPYKFNCWVNPQGLRYILGMS